MALLSRKTKRYSLVAAASVFGLFCLKSDCGSRQEIQQREVTEVKATISSPLNDENKGQNISLGEKTSDPIKLGLVEELKKEFSYSSLDCKIVKVKREPFPKM